MKIEEANPFVVQPIQIRRLQDWIAVARKITITLIVGQQKDDIRTDWFFGSGRRQSAGSTYQHGHRRHSKSNDPIHISTPFPGRADKMDDIDLSLPAHESFAMPTDFAIVPVKSQHVMTVRTDIDPLLLAAALIEILPEVFQHVTKCGGQPAGPAFCRSDMTPGGLLGMEAGYPVVAPLPAQGRIQPKVLPGCDAARAVHVGDYSEIAKTGSALLQWVLGQRREPAGPAWWSFVTDPAERDVAKRQTEIYLPLRPIG